MNEGKPAESRPEASAVEGDDAAWPALGYEAALPWLTSAALPLDEPGTLVVAPSAE
ncbi:hypothetical protein [Rubrivivax gelatinosus]|uniref:hypothetical protein n=1 Tax=Rubrivivax gelatinosus TaxID=28068 RepID=UPI001905A6A1|nr:hypothetical protein [Rubrivivax gelatinosus]